MCLGEAHCITEFEGKGTLFTSYKRVLSINKEKKITLLIIPLAEGAHGTLLFSVG